MYSQVISVLEDPLSRHSQVIISSSIDNTVCLWLAVILGIWKISVNHWKLPCCYKYFDCGIWIKTVRIIKGWIIEGLRANLIHLCTNCKVVVTYPFILYPICKCSPHGCHTYKSNNFCQILFLVFIIDQYFAQLISLLSRF